jgi:hypothetical protein
MQLFGCRCLFGDTFFGTLDGDDEDVLLNDGDGY